MSVTGTPIAGSSFNAMDMLQEDTIEDFAKYSGMDETDIVDGEKFSIDKINSPAEQDAIALIEEKLGLTSEQLELYDMDTVAGLMAIANAMQAVEDGTADDAQKDLLTHADDFFSQLYACCLETETKLDGESVAGAVDSYKLWLEGKNPDGTPIVKIGADGKEEKVDIKGQFSRDQIDLLDDKFKNKDGTDKIFSATEDKTEIGSSVFDIPVQETTAAGEDDGSDDNGGGDGDADDDTTETKPAGDHAGHNHG